MAAAHQHTAEAIWAAANSYAGYIVALLVLYNVAIAAKHFYTAKKLGCKPFKASRYDWLGGLKLAYILLKNQKNNTLVDYQHEAYNEANAETFVTKVAGTGAVITRHPDNIKAVLATQFNEFALGTRHAALLPLLGDGIFTLDYEGWKHSRAMLRPQFAREQVAHISSLEPHMQNLAEHIRNAKGQPFDIQELFFRLTVDSATEFLFGESCESLCDGTISKKPSGQIDEQLRESFAHSFNEAQEYLAKRILLKALSFLVYKKEYKEDCDRVHQFTDFFVHKALSCSDEELDKYSKGGYVFLYELAKQTKDPKILRDQVLNVLLAGRDTTAGLLSFTFLELARNPEIYHKLKEEVYDKFGSGDNVDLSAITFETLKKCEYLKAVINETLRLYPSVPSNFRVANRDTSLPRGGGPDEQSPVFIPKNTMIIYNIASTHRNPLYYGKDADVYRPDRWFEPSTRKLGWAYLPFNGGPRICLGQQFALTEASYVIVRLLQMFPHIESHISQYPPRKTSNLTMNVTGAVNVSLKE